MPMLIPSPSLINASGNKPKVIEEFVGKVNNGTGAVSIARTKSPAGWTEPGQTPEFDEYTIVLHGTLRVATRAGTFDVTEGQAVIAAKGEWVQYGSPGITGAEYISVCIPAFSVETVHRDTDAKRRS
jgi:mannose-6-phosphate isomerase-like protein (cupin superfamily)